MNEELEPKIGASIGIVIILLILLSGAVGVAVQKFNTPVPTHPLVDEVLIRYSTSSPLAMSFLYPRSLFLEEKQIEGEKGRYPQIVLTENTEENKLLREGKAPPRDGPVAITLEVIDRRHVEVPAEEWILHDDRSNYGLATSILSTTTVAGFPGFSYTTTGLYESDTSVFFVDTHGILLRVTYITKDDLLRSTFINTVLPSLTIGPYQ